MNLQGDCLEEIKNSKKEVQKIILTKGISIQGTFEGHNKYSIIIKVNGKQQIVRYDRQTHVCLF